jgi:hypothetical protein
MANNNSWAKQWTILDADGSGKKLCPEGSQFTLEAQPPSGEILCYRLHAGKLIDQRFDGRPFYPVGVRGLTFSSLPAWSKDAKVRNLYLDAAERVKGLGRIDPLAARLESTVKINGSSAVARIYLLKGVRQDGRDWIVLDIVTPKGSAARTLSAAAAGDDDGDGTGHGDG